MIPDHLYACSRQDELWRIRGSGRELQETRTEEGHCLTTVRSGAITIEATDDFTRTYSERFTAPGRIAEELRALRPRTETMLQRLLAARANIPDAWLRIMTTVRAVQSEQQRAFSATITATLRIQRQGQSPLSITTDPEHVPEHLALLGSCARSDEEVEVDYRLYPVLWKHGSGAVLLHEAIGHPAEQSRFMHWPEWLEVRDDPAAEALGRTTLDDTAQPVSTRLLSAGEAPAALRRESFREVPLRRMTSLVVTSSRPAALAPERIEVLLLGGGSYDITTDRVSLEVSAARLLSGSGSRSLAPFRFVETRESIRRVLRGSHGTAATYPGVICGDEGQRLPVGAIAPDLLTDALS